MPELPEVETTLRGISPHIVGVKVKRMIVRQAQLRWPVDPALIHASDFRINALHRRAKYLIFDTQRGLILAHLGMSGSYRIVHQDTAAQKHDHIDWQLENGTLLRYHDPRRFGSLFSISSLDHPLLSKLAPEPLTEAFNADYLLTKLSSKKNSIKAAIMDQQCVVGVGNIYASESLYAAGIHPLKVANSVKKTAISKLVVEIKSVLQHAIEQGGTTLRDFVGSDGKAGYFAQALQVYGRDNEPCKRCNTIIEKTIINQRASFYCKKCQR